MAFTRAQRREIYDLLAVRKALKRFNIIEMQSPQWMLRNEGNGLELEQRLGESLQLEIQQASDNSALERIGNNRWIPALISILARSRNKERSDTLSWS